MPFDINSVREDFPILKTGIAYFDAAASSLTPEPVVRKMGEFYHEYRANVHRGAHRLTKRASEEYEAVYEKLKKFFNAKDGAFVNVNNTTMGINLVALGLETSPEQNIVTTQIEHHSNLLPWVRMEKRKQVSELRIVKPADREAHFDLEDFEKAVDRNTRLVAVTAASNVLGNKMPVKEIVKIAHDSGALALVDAAQAAGHRKSDFSDWDADFVAFSGHKMLAPTGSGALYVGPGASVDSAMVGGGTIKDADLHSYELLPLPDGLEAGSPNIASFIGLGATLDYISAIGVENVESQERKVVEKIAEGMERFGIEYYGPRKIEERGSPVAFNVKGIDEHQVAIMLDQIGKVCVRSGHHCALPITRMLGIKGSVRASVHVYNAEQDAQVLLDALGKVKGLA